VDSDGRGGAQRDDGHPHEQQRHDSGEGGEGAKIAPQQVVKSEEPRIELDRCGGSQYADAPPVPLRLSSQPRARSIENRPGPVAAIAIATVSKVRLNSKPPFPLKNPFGQ
jgi:hypothetical protein